MKIVCENILELGGGYVGDILEIIEDILGRFWDILVIFWTLLIYLGAFTGYLKYILRIFCEYS